MCMDLRDFVNVHAENDLFCFVITTDQNNLFHSVFDSGLVTTDGENNPFHLIFHSGLMNSDYYAENNDAMFMLPGHDELSKNIILAHCQ